MSDREVWVLQWWAVGEVQAWCTHPLDYESENEARAAGQKEGGAAFEGVQARGGWRAVRLKQLERAARTESVKRETEEQRAARLDLERETRSLGSTIAEMLPEGIGYALLLFDLGEGGSMTYSSNAKRADMVRALRELASHLEAGAEGER